MLRTILILSFLISSIFSFNIENIENFVNNSINTVYNKIKNDNNRSCDDDTTCNFGEEGECQYADIGPDGVCDCDGNIFDCSGECGGSDFSCITMESSDMGFYENNNCTGSYNSLSSGMCFIESDNLDPSFMFNEDACIAEGGAWLNADSCYAFDFDMSATEEECLTMDGGLLVINSNLLW